jgi:hypothetical protein
MKRIKASEILQMNPSINLEGFNHFAIDKNGYAHVYTRKPADGYKSWYFRLVEKDGDGDCKFVKIFDTPFGWKESLREIDFENR